MLAQPRLILANDVDLSFPLGHEPDTLTQGEKACRKHR